MDFSTIYWANTIQQAIILTAEICFNSFPSVHIGWTSNALNSTLNVEVNGRWNIHLVDTNKELIFYSSPLVFTQHNSKRWGQLFGSPNLKYGHLLLERWIYLTVIGPIVRSMPIIVSFSVVPYLKMFKNSLRLDSIAKMSRMTLLLGISFLWNSFVCCSSRCYGINSSRGTEHQPARLLQKPTASRQKWKRIPYLFTRSYLSLPARLYGIRINRGIKQFLSRRLGCQGRTWSSTWAFLGDRCRRKKSKAQPPRIHCR